MKEMRDRNVAPDRLNLALLGGFAVLALVLAIARLHGAEIVLASASPGLDARTIFPRPG